VTKKLVEQGSLLEAKSSNGLIPVRIITEGEGSSGVYSRDLLKEHAGAFNNALSFKNHPIDPNKPWERDFTWITGRVVGEARYEERDGIAGIYADYKPDAKYREILEEYSEYLGLSVFIEGDGREVDGKYVVESFNGADPYKSVDVVIAPGRGGGFERVMEAYRNIETSAIADDGTATAAADLKKKEDKAMDEVKALVEALAKSMDDKFTALEAKVDSVVQLSESAHVAETEKVEALDVADKLAEAKLSETGRKRVLESVKAGKPVADAIKVETELRDEILAEAKAAAPAGRVIEHATATDDFTVGGWK